MNENIEKNIMDFSTRKKLGVIEKNHKIIASLTSFPFRIKTIHIVMERIFNQTLLADEVHLYLAKEQFPNRENDLTTELIEFCKKGLKIIWVDEDLRPHKKYFYVMQNHSDDIVITLDDDVIYDLDVFEKLYNSYLKYPNAVSAMRARAIKFNENNQFKSYSEWNNCSDITSGPSMSLLAIGVGGTLYPPNCMHNELFNIDNIFNLCPDADDLWLKTMQIMNNTPTVLVKKSERIIHIDGSQEITLHHENLYENKNDIQINSIFNVYNQYFGKNDTLINRMTKTSQLENKLDDKDIEIFNNREMLMEIQDIKISVIVPVYNVQDYLERCLDSIINQTYRNLEIILVNDGSTDNSEEICNKYCNIDSRMTIINKLNGGLSSARNAGMEICTGDFISFIDSDDYIHPMLYEICLSISKQVDVDYVEFNLTKVFGDKKFSELNFSNYEIHTAKEVLQCRVNWEKHHVYACNKVFKRDFIMQFKFPHIAEVGEDNFIFNQYVLKINRVAFVPLYLYYYFQRQGSLTKSIFNKEHLGSLKARIELFWLVKNNYHEISEKQLYWVVKYFFIDFGIFTEQRNDRDKKMRLALIEIFMNVYDDALNSSILTTSQRNDIILAKSNPEKFILKQEKGIVRKI